MRGILYEKLLARKSRCSRRRRVYEANISTPVAIDQHAANCLEETASSFTVEQLPNRRGRELFESAECEENTNSDLNPRLDWNNADYELVTITTQETRGRRVGIWILGGKNACSYVFDGIVRTFLDMENVRLLPLPARSPNFSSIENIWSMVAKRLAHQHMPVTTDDELWHLIEAA
ncbi:hypothetical protein TNCV_1902951 [Trichonephila clavipes]|nr:hypothetical protein TNCV_1902951 [Trichonephila clavipes]